MIQLPGAHLARASCAPFKAAQFIERLLFTYNPNYAVYHQS